MERKIFFLDSNNKKIKWLGTAWNRVAIMPIIDVIMLLFVFPGVLHLLGEYKVADLHIDGTAFGLYILVISCYIVISTIIAFIDFVKYRNLTDNTIIAKENANIILVKSQNRGTLAFQKEMSEEDNKAINEINKIFDERPKGYKFTEYKNCKLVKETKDYYAFSGEKNGVASNFKIYKVYANIDFINEEEN